MNIVGLHGKRSVDRIQFRFNAGAILLVYGDPFEYSPSPLAILVFLNVKSLELIDTLQAALTPFVGRTMANTVQGTSGVGRNAIYTFYILHGSLGNAFTRVVVQSTLLA